MSKLKNSSSFKKGGLDDPREEERVRKDVQHRMGPIRESIGHAQMLSDPSTWKEMRERVGADGWTRQAEELTMRMQETIVSRTSVYSS